MLTTDARRGEVIVWPPAEVDVATGATFARQIAQAGALRPDRVVIDFEAVTFCDSTAVQVLMKGLEDLEQLGCVLVIRNPPHQLRRIAEILRLTAALGIPAQRER